MKSFCRGEGTLKGKFLIFTIGNEDYGSEIRYATEIIGGIQQITEVPDCDRLLSDDVVKILIEAV